MAVRLNRVTVTSVALFLAGGAARSVPRRAFHRGRLDFNGNRGRGETARRPWPSCRETFRIAGDSRATRQLLGKPYPRLAAFSEKLSKTLRFVARGNLERFLDDTRPKRERERERTKFLIFPRGAYSLRTGVQRRRSGSKSVGTRRVARRASRGGRGVWRMELKSIVRRVGGDFPPVPSRNLGQTVALPPLRRIIARVRRSTASTAATATLR